MITFAWSMIAVIVLALALFALAAWLRARRIPVLEPDAVITPDQEEDE